MMNDPERDDDPQEVFQAPDGSTWYPHRGHWCWKTATTLAERDATIAALRAEVADLLPMLDADAMTISNQQAEIDRLRAGITAAGGLYHQDVHPGPYEMQICRHARSVKTFCPGCLMAHLRALLYP